MAGCRRQGFIFSRPPLTSLNQRVTAKGKTLRHAQGDNASGRLNYEPSTFNCCRYFARLNTTPAQYNTRKKKTLLRQQGAFGAITTTFARQNKMHLTNQQETPNIQDKTEYKMNQGDKSGVTVVRWPATTRGAIGCGLDLLVTFASRQK